MDSKLRLIVLKQQASQLEPFCTSFWFFFLPQAFPTREPETVLQRYHRLKQEVSDLVSDVEGIKESKELGNVSAGDIISDVSDGDT